MAGCLHARPPLTSLASSCTKPRSLPGVERLAKVQLKALEMQPVERDRTEQEVREALLHLHYVAMVIFYIYISFSTSAHVLLLETEALS